MQYEMCKFAFPQYLLWPMGMTCESLSSKRQGFQPRETESPRKVIFCTWVPCWKDSSHLFVAGLQLNMGERHRKASKSLVYSYGIGGFAAHVRLLGVGCAATVVCLGMC